MRASPDLSPVTRSETDSLQADTRWRFSEGALLGASSEHDADRPQNGGRSRETGDRSGLVLLRKFRTLSKLGGQLESGDDGSVVAPKASSRAAERVVDDHGLASAPAASLHFAGAVA